MHPIPRLNLNLASGAGKGSTTATARMIWGRKRKHNRNGKDDLVSVCAYTCTPHLGITRVNYIQEERHSFMTYYDSVAQNLEAELHLEPHAEADHDAGLQCCRPGMHLPGA